MREAWFYLDAGCTVMYTLKKSTKGGALMIYECFSTTSTQVPGGWYCRGRSSVSAFPALVFLLMCPLPLGTS